MNPPLCLCGCGRPVQRARSGESPKRRGPRYVGTVQWRWFASRACSGTVNGTHSRDVLMRGVRAWQDAARRRRLERLREACRPFMDDAGRVPVDAMVKVFAREIQLAKAQGAYLAREQMRRRSA